MQTRPNAYDLAPNIPKLGSALQEAILATGLDKRLVVLIQVRVSQMNGCAFCIHMHTREAKRLGETEARLYLLSAWHESTLFSAAERAMLAWTEALTLVAQRGAPPDSLFDELKKHFSDNQIVGINSAVAMINFWNRMAIGSAAVSPHERA
jgi:AhpD family alkylhydroperoxidase